MQLAFGVAGAALGGFLAPAGFFGISGSSLGWTLGQLLGNQFEPAKELEPRTGPRLGDLKVQTSTYGASIPICYGTVRIAGNIFWAPPITEIASTETITQGGKGGGGGTTQTNTTFAYYGDFAVGLCEGQTYRSGSPSWTGGITVLKVWANGKLIYDVINGSPVESVLASTNAMTVYPGTETQAIDPLMEADNPTLTPAYRGTAFALFNQLPLAQFGNRLPNLEFEVAASGFSQDYLVPVELYTLPDGRQFYFYGPASTEGKESVWKGVRNTSGAQYIWAVVEVGSPGTNKQISLFNNYTQEEVLTITPDDPTHTLGIIGVGLEDRVWVSDHPPGTTQATLKAYSTTGELQYEFPSPLGQPDDTQRLLEIYEYPPDDGTDPYANPILYIEVDPTAAGRRELYYIRNNTLLGTMEQLEVESDGLIRDRIEPLENPQGIQDRFYIFGRWSGIPPFSAGNCVIGWFDPYHPVIDDGEILHFTEIIMYDRVTEARAIVGPDGYIYARSQNTNMANVLEKYTQDGVLVDSLTLTGLSAIDYGGTDRMAFDAAGRLYWQTMSPSPNIVWRINYGTMEILAYKAMPDLDYMIIGGDPYQTRGILLTKSEQSGEPFNKVYVLLDTTSQSYPTLAEVVTDICLRCGLTTSDLDVTDLESTIVTGYIVPDRMTGRAAIEPLMGVYFFDAVESDDKIKFVMRGGATAATIAEDDLAAHTGEPATLPDQLQITRRQEMELPVQIDFAYINKEIDYQISTQIARRTTTQSEMKTTIKAPIVLTDTEAKRVVDTLIFNAHVERQSFEFMTARKYANREPTDLFTVTKNSISYGIRITDKDEGADGVIRWKGVADATYIYAQTSTGVSGGLGQQEIVAVTPAQTLFLDSPLLRNEDDSGGFYVGTFTSGSFRGAQLYRSTDGGATYEAVTNGLLLSETTAGYTTVAPDNLDLDEHNEVFDHASKIRVVMDNGSLTSVTRDQVLDGENVAMVGGEILQFTTATLVDTDTYDLTGLLRGRLGTEDQMDSHAAGERFVLLTDDLRTVSQSASDMGVQRHFKLVATGWSLQQAGARVFVNTMRRLKPLAPWHVAAGPDSDGNLIVRWDRRTRYQFSQNSASVEAPLGETTELYRINFYSISTSGSPVVETLTLVNSYESTEEEFIYSLEDQEADFGNQVFSCVIGVQQINTEVGPGFEKQFEYSIGGGPHYYWRLFEMQLPGGADIWQCPDIALYEGSLDVSLGGTNVSTPGVMQCTSNFVVAGDIPSWFTNPRSFTNSQPAPTKASCELATSYVLFDFNNYGRKVTLTSMNLSGKGDLALRYLSSFKLQYSDDNVNWTTQKTVTGLTEPPTQAFYATAISLL